MTTHTQVFLKGRLDVGEALSTAVQPGTLGEALSIAVQPGTPALCTAHRSRARNTPTLTSLMLNR